MEHRGDNGGRSRGAGLVLGVVLDRVLGDPQRHHPVAWFGRWSGWLEQRLWRDTATAGAAHTVAAVVPVVALGWVAERLTRRHPIAHAAVTAVATWVALGARTLVREGEAMSVHLAAADLPAARGRLPHLCGRDAAGLDSPEIARAVVESLAENSTDAVVASVLWGAVAGVPGVLGHRAVNTLDAIVGHRSDRYARFGSVAARLDDVLAWVPARLTGVWACALAPAVGGDAGRAWRTMIRDHGRHPSPNGGWPESAWAGALGVQLGGRNVYSGGRVEERGLLGDGPRPGAAEVRRAARLVGVVTAVATVAAAGTTVVVAAAGRGRR